jgi:hypothetical protein
MFCVTAIVDSTLWSKIGATEPVLFWCPYGSLRRVHCTVASLFVCMMYLIGSPQLYFFSLKSYFLMFPKPTCQGCGTMRSFGLSHLGLSRLIPAYLLSHNTIHSTSRALFLESAEQALCLSYIYTNSRLWIWSRNHRGEYIYAHAWGDSDTSRRS